MATLIAHVGPFEPHFYAELTPFQALMRAVLAQQVSKYAAQAVLQRVYALFPEVGVPEARHLASADEVSLRQAGVSRRKVETIQRLARAAIDGTLPGRATLDAMSESKIHRCLTAFKGIGPWTVDMLLIFNLMRPDVFPAGDLGVRRGYKIAFDCDVLPSPGDLRKRAEAWRPYRTVAAWYLWRANDL